MRKYILAILATATLMPGMAMAQPTAELRRDRQDVRVAQQDLRHAQTYGNSRDVRNTRQDVRTTRQESREDWRDYRAQNRATFARGKWNAPFRYQRVSTGATIRPAYYANRYVISNPARYRLPAAGKNMNWVRHYDDVLLVNTRTGKVARVYQNFFW